MAYVWEKSYPLGVHRDCPLPPAMPLESLLETAATTWPDRIAIILRSYLYLSRTIQSSGKSSKGSPHFRLLASNVFGSRAKSESNSLFPPLVSRYPVLKTRWR